MAEWNFDGAVAVVTGGAGGIGRALGARLAAEACRVALVDLDLDTAQRAAAEVDGAIGLAADVGDGAAVQRVVEEVEDRLGPVDIYCSNAGVATFDGLGGDDDWEVSWRVHAMAHVHGARSALPGMVERRHGAMVVTASAAGLLMTLQSAPYTVSKHAAVAIAEWLAVRYGGAGVQVHCLCPQGVNTPMLDTNAFGRAQLTATGSIIEPSAVADAVVAAIRADRFLVLPHPEVHGYELRKVADRDRWLNGMRKLAARFRE